MSWSGVERGGMGGRRRVGSTAHHAAYCEAPYNWFQGPMGTTEGKCNGSVIQWNLSNLDTLGTEESVLISEVS